MQRYSVEFMTGDTAGHPVGIQPANMAQIKFSRHDGVMADDGSNYLNNSLHLDDVYNIINRDLSMSSGIRTASPLIPKMAHDRCEGRSSEDDTPTSHVLAGYRATKLEDDVTPLCSPVDGTAGYSDEADELERGTPSPNRDSGIESDVSPAVTQSHHNIRAKCTHQKTLKDLEKKAKAVQPKKSSSSSTTGVKPGQSYLVLIAQAILSSHDQKMALAEIYRHIIDNHSYYDNEETAWRNSIRYTLSINECFVKAGKEENGKGNYWAIHPNCVDAFKSGDFRRRQARRRARRNLQDTSATDRRMSAPNAYVPMTPYTRDPQPYPVTMSHANQHAPTSQTAYHTAASAGPYYPVPRYQAAQYTPMSTPAYVATPVQGYMQPPTRAIPHAYQAGYIPNSYCPIEAHKTRYEHTAQGVTSTEPQMSQNWTIKHDDIPSGNTIIINSK